MVLRSILRWPERDYTLDSRLPAVTKTSIKSEADGITSKSIRIFEIRRGEFCLLSGKGRIKPSLRLPISRQLVQNGLEWRCRSSIASAVDWFLYSTNRESSHHISPHHLFLVRSISSSAGNGSRN
jgi:hypothetical protein